MILKDKLNIVWIWILLLLSIITLSIISFYSLKISLFFFALCVTLPFLWFLLKDQKFILIFILLSILPGMLGRFTTEPKGGTAILLTDLLIMILMLGFLLKKVSVKKDWKLSQVHSAIFIFFLVACISFFNGIYHLYDLGTLELKEVITSFLYLMRWIGYACIFFSLHERIKENKKERNYWLNWLVIITFATSILGFLQLIFYPDFFDMFVNYGWDPHKNRLLGTFFDPNLIGSFLAFNATVFIGILLHSKNLKKNKWLIFVTTISLIAMVLTLSRTSYIAFLGGFVIITLLKSRKILIIGLMCMLAGLLLNPTVFERISQGVTIDDSAQKHIESWVDGANLIKSYPILGIGYNMLPSVYDDLALVDEWDVNNRSGIENSFFTIWVTTGIIGLLSYLYIYLILIIKSYKNWQNKKLSNNYRGLNLGILGGIIALIISSAFVNSLLFSYIVVFFWFYSSLITEE